VNLRERCEALVKEWGECAAEWKSDSWDEGRGFAHDSDANDLQAALDATEGEGRDAARWRQFMKMDRSLACTVISRHPRIDAPMPWTIQEVVDAAMKESKP
jgi:hypothetical protein